MSGLFGSVTVKGNRLTDFASQTAAVGIPIPFGFGKFPCEGNVIFAPMPPKEHVRKKKQGKGGVKTEEYTYTLSYAVAFCEGPIFGFWSIRRNGKIVWSNDPNASVEDKAYSAKWAQKATFYLGTETQMPDSTIESYKGAGRVSAHRGLAYIVVEDDDVTDNGGAVPTYEAVVIASPPDVYLTSRPYPIDGLDGLTGQTALVKGNMLEWPRDYMFAPLPVLSAGDIRDIRQYHNQEPQDFIQGELPIFVEGNISDVRKYYNLTPQDFVWAPNLPILTAGNIRTVRINYNHKPEDFISGALPILTQGNIA